jgi:hypothetical protein
MKISFVLSCEKLINVSRLLQREINEGVLPFICFRAVFFVHGRQGNSIRQRLMVLGAGEYMK